MGLGWKKETTWPVLNPGRREASGCAPGLGSGVTCTARGMSGEAEGVHVLWRKKARKTLKSRHSRGFYA